MFMRVPLLLVAAVSSVGLCRLCRPARRSRAPTARAPQRPRSSWSSVRLDPATPFAATPSSRGSFAFARARSTIRRSAWPGSLRTFPPPGRARFQARPLPRFRVDRSSCSTSVRSRSWARRARPRARCSFPARCPIPAAMVSGVFYSSRAADVFVAGSRVSLRSAGGPDLARRLLDHGHRAARGLRREGRTLGDAVSTCRWDATDADAHDLVYVDVLSPAPHAVMRCAGTDSRSPRHPAVAIGGDRRRPARRPPPPQGELPREGHRARRGPLRRREDRRVPALTSSFRADALLRS